ncbi:MAG: DUF4830 domain-containing protein [Oscillospiraceae bacterium]|nr:DUF4830 domain-containing protein [Oscillospiraceae bacterium]
MKNNVSSTNPNISEPYSLTPKIPTEFSPQGKQSAKRRNPLNLPLIGIGLICLLLIILFIASQVGRANTPNRPGKVDSANQAGEYLAGFGWEVSTAPISVRTVQIPQEFSPAYEEYNTLQKSQGFDLSPHRTKSVIIYTFRVLNHPSPDDVFANVMTLDGVVIAGDVVSYALDGFLTGLEGRTA